MDQRDVLARAVRGAPQPSAGRGVPDARVAERGRRRRPGGLAAAQPLGRGRDREPRRLADHRRRAGLPEQLQSRRTRREDPLDAVRVPEPVISRADGVDPEQEALLADSVGLALLVVLEALPPAERLAFVLHDMFAVPFDEIAADRRPLADRGAPARQPRAAPRAGRGARARSGPRAPAGGRRRVLRRGPRGRLRRARRRARPRRRPALRRRGVPSRRLGRRPRRGGRGGPGDDVRAARRPTCVPRSSTAPPASSWRPRVARSRSWASRSATGRVVAIDALADPERLARAGLDGPGRLRRAALRLGGLRQLLQGPPPARASRAALRASRGRRRRSVGTRTDLLGELNPALRVPTLVLDDGRPLAESNAILWYLAEGTPFVPEDRSTARPGAAVAVLRAVQPRAVHRGRAVLADARRLPAAGRRDRGTEGGRPRRARGDGASPRDAHVPRRRGATPSRTSRCTRTRTSRTRAASTWRRTRRCAPGWDASRPSRGTSRSRTEVRRRWTRPSSDGEPGGADLARRARRAGGDPVAAGAVRDPALDAERAARRRWSSPAW